MTSLGLTVHSVAQRGMANQERIILRATANGRINEYGITLALSSQRGPLPFVDKCFWFADAVEFQEGDWVFIFTGPGKPRVDNLTAPFTGRLYTYYWGREETIFFHPSITPLLFRILEFTALDAPVLLTPQTQAAPLSLPGQDAPTNT